MSDPDAATHYKNLMKTLGGTAAQSNMGLTTVHRPLPVSALNSSRSSAAVDPALLARYEGRAHADFIAQYAHILDDRPRMTGWLASKPMHLWRPDEHASYLRDGSPRNMEDIVRIMGTVGNERQY